MRRTAAVVAGLMLLAGCGQSYEDKVEACTKAVRAHDFNTHPLSEGERVSGCGDLKEEDYNTIVLHNVMGDLGWLDDEGNFDKNKMLESTIESGG